VHVDKLEKMGKPQDIKKLAQTVEFELEKKKLEKLKNHEFLNQERNMMINRHNQILLNKLVDISHGKWVFSCFILMIINLAIGQHQRTCK
jgi:Hemingway/CFA97